MAGHITKGLAIAAFGTLLACGSAGVAHARSHSAGAASDGGSYAAGQDDGTGMPPAYSAPETGTGGGVPQFQNDNAESDQMSGAMMMPGSASGSAAPGMTDGSYTNMNIGGEDSAILPGVN
ncbi:hypothetical protein B0W47_06955 [Komagataeibacter nataicola]|uniref:Lipoprotein n=1 Tax=Komagataeibacter nataicola TaxID=265960 RepID=A0A9N7C7D0_9PROT|nr:hypothetical protein [Komagataeibacter nataicola]AQU87253.1 hypothetical protein B0W47_06955 [Komagataeibacter nataicola]PYD67482.1 hypothetical protein CDI09_02875 [Komagataeibacter nataicola]WEQ55859.1 hypothetical protein LV564_01720 [Komagataeibacter nataicola]WNM09280.1 hypothetical protein RI056_04645 [Komagataeibacter nataicola]GBR14767.1 hypothetical protein AA0616_0391 [Komagataeibacter nataicola NRIC 0616]